MSSRMQMGLVVICIICSARCCGIWYMVRKRPNMVETPTTMRMVPVEMFASFMASNTSLKLSFLVMKKPTNRAYHTATTDASTGVQAPVYMPPRMMTGVNKDHMFAYHGPEDVLPGVAVHGALKSGASGNGVGSEHEGGAHQDAGHEPRGEQCGDRNVCDDAVDQHGVTGGDEDAQRAPGG